MTPTLLVSLVRLSVRRARAIVRLGPPTAGAAVLVNDPAGRLLLVRSPYRRGWCVPGGYAEPRESYTQTIRREMREELDLSLGSDLRLVAETIPGRRNHVTAVFAARVDDAVARRVRSCTWELSEVRWFAPDELTSAHLVNMPRSARVALITAGLLDARLA